MNRLSEAIALFNTAYVQYMKLQTVYLSDLKALPGEASCSCCVSVWEEVHFNIHFLTVMIIHIQQMDLYKRRFRFHRVKQFLKCVGVCALISRLFGKNELTCTCHILKFLSTSVCSSGALVSCIILSLVICKSFTEKGIDQLAKPTYKYKYSWNVFIVFFTYKDIKIP